MSLWETATDWVRWLEARPAERRFIGSVPGANVHEDPFGTMVAGSAFAPGASYFSLRLVEMHLALAREWFREYLPMCVTLAEYTHGDQKRAVPFVVSNDLLKDVLKQAGAGAARVEFKNLYAVRNAPVNANNLSLFTGLFSVKHSDFAESLLDLLADVGREVGGQAAGKGVEVARIVYDRLGKLFSLKDVNSLVGSLDGAALTASGYRVFAGLPEHAINPEDLFMKAGRLHMRLADGAVRAATNADYCVVAVEYRESLAQPGLLTALPFNQLWKEVSPFLAQRNTEAAEAALQKLESAVLTSPDLSEADRIPVIAAYQKSYTHLSDVLAKPKAGAATRGASTRDFVARLVTAADAQKERQHGEFAKLLDTVAQTIIEPELSTEGSLREGSAMEAHAATFRAKLGAPITDPAVSARLATALTAARLGRN